MSSVLPNTPCRRNNGEAADNGDQEDHQRQPGLAQPAHGPVTQGAAGALLGLGELLVPLPVAAAALGFGGSGGGHGRVRRLLIRGVCHGTGACAGGTVDGHERLQPAQTGPPYRSPTNLSNTAT